MIKETNISLPPEFLNEKSEIEKRISAQIGVAANRIKHYKLLRRSIDARGRKVLYQLRFQVWVDENINSEEKEMLHFQNVSNQKPVYIVGLGPAGLFAGLELIALGLKPIILERGKEVRARRRDLAVLNKEGIVNPESNYCFGEGGAGTFSDGKLYTRSTKRGDTQKVLNILHHFGATEEILIDAHPHIGTNKLPQIIQSMREKIVECGGEVHFETKLTNVFVEFGKLTAIEINGNERVTADSLILATGHSARDIFSLLHQNKIQLHAKPFALGVRIEHPQSIIDSVQYHCSGERHENLPAASYSLVQQVENKGVYSFCMCPGGIICPASTDNEIVVVNGWSPSKRDSPFANSGMVVEIALEDFAEVPTPLANENGEVNPLAGVHFQHFIEEKAYLVGGGKQVAPAQRLMDFIHKKTSQNLPECSYLPGLKPTNMQEVLPAFVANRLRKGFQNFGKSMPRYLTNEAVIVGVESRTSSPVRIPRELDTLMHPQVQGLFPCGEGAGYAGGIMSAAIDGQKCANAALHFIKNKSVEF